MSTQPPSLPDTERTAWRTDIFDLPGLRWLAERWRTVIFANGAVRREAKGLLFAELAEAARRGMPMAAALDLACESQADTRRRSGTRKPIARGLWGNAGLVAWGISMFIVANFTMWIYAIFAWRFADPARVARLLSWKLRAHAMKGFSLSDAMRACAPEDFDPQEIAIVAQGEKSGTLPQALRHLADFMVTENRIAVMGTQALTPVFYIGLIAFPVILFWSSLIAPKFRDIFNQLGAELPALTSAVIHFGESSGIWLLALFCIIFLFFLLRALMNGNAASQVAVVLLGAGLAGTLGAWAMAVASGSSVPQEYAPVLILVIIAALAVVLVLLPAVLSDIERFVLRVERFAAPLVRLLPFVGAAQRAQAEARWMAALGVGLDAGLPPHEALEGAGTMSGGALGHRTEEAAALACKGLSIGAACERCKVLRPTVNHQLALVDWRGDYRGGLRAIADDTSFRATETMRRSARFADVFMMTAFAILTFFTVMAMYLPLFGIPRIVGR
jgi:type II secretory pathway component PulF